MVDHWWDRTYSGAHIDMVQLGKCWRNICWFSRFGFVCIGNLSKYFGKPTRRLTGRKTFPTNTCLFYKLQTYIFAFQKLIIHNPDFSFWPNTQIRKYKYRKCWFMFVTRAAFECWNRVYTIRKYKSNRCCRKFGIIPNVFGMIPNGFGFRGF